MMTETRKLNRKRTIAAAFCCLALAGCGGGPPTGQVEGKVTFQGQTLDTGEVRLVASQGAAVGKIQPDGTFTAQWKRSPNIPVGEYRVAITPPQPPLPPSADAPTEMTKDPRFPKKYQRTATTPLVVSVAVGSNTYELKMK